MPREYTTDEVREQFLDYVRDTIQYWVKHPSNVQDRVSGAVFSVLAAIDGSAGSLPGFVLAPSPHPDDKAYNQKNGDNWYPDAPTVNCDIAGSLHERLYREARK